MSIRSRLTIAIAAVMVITIAGLGWAMVQTTRATLIDQLDAQVEDQAYRRTRAPDDNSQSDPPPSGTYDDYSSSQTDGNPWDKHDFAYILYGADGSVLEAVSYGYAENRLPLPDCPDIPSPELDSMLNQVVTLPSVDGTVNYRTLMQNLPDGDIQAIALPLTQVDDAVQTMVQRVLLTSALAVLAATAISWWVIRRGLQPVDHMVDTAAAIAAGDLGARMNASQPGTELARLETALNDMMTQIQTSDDARAAGERRLRRFVADAAHELRTPLTSLRGYAELYRQGALPDTRAVDNAIGRIESEGARMARLVDDLLLLARMDQDRGIERKPVDLTALVRDAVADFEVVATDHPATLAVTPALVVQGDRMRLRQVVDNLLSNTRTHTPAGTSVHVSVQREGDNAVIAVSDTGPGVSAEDQAHIFERFWRADPARTRNTGGSGLGLAIVASLVDAHGGSIAIESTVGAGATFRVRIPLKPTASLPDHP